MSFTLAGKPISQNGLGLMRLTWPQDPVPDEQAFKVLKAALAAGVHVWNGADFYGTPANNSLHLMHRYFTAFPEDANKVMDGSPVGMRRSVDNANAILAGRKTIDLFECGRVDPSVPIEETVGGLAALKAEGKIGGIQLSEVSAAAATNSTVIDMVEAEVSLWATDIFTNGVAATCADLNITVVAHTPLGAGMLTGQIQSLEDMPAHDHHRHFPRFQPENFSQNLKLVDEVNRLAMSKGCTTAQLALSWIKAHTKIAPGMPVIVPVFGARSEERVRENVVDVDLTDEDLRSINAILDSFPVAGGRYPAAAARLTEY